MSSIICCWYSLEGLVNLFNCIRQLVPLLELKFARVMTVREFDLKLAYTEWDKMRARSEVKMVEGQRCYEAEKGGGTSRSSDGFSCTLQFRKLTGY
ncbi:hypothetical protein K505DRAFT_255765 [Melanomma pulvis-pyrius CBS 109.77]|uniref:Uncharacterized protein n=1 Tax=Melanomma pulvis-pyrius CBS 109.77 TaxID=1314802 RepID=A0A6A6WVV3_9PLEO|nr:hypothetical protein K505DRAFT_255765 [Melanomma pulvis-pyrius CBS 109.77]